jgi:hypothetical protein
MKWTSRTRDQKLKEERGKYQEWHKYFAWKPVVVASCERGVTKVWLRCIIRRGEFNWTTEQKKLFRKRKDYNSFRWEYKENKGQLLREKIENGPPI